MQHVSRERNGEVDALVVEQLETLIVAILGFLPPKFKGKQHLQDIVQFLEIGECPQGMEKAKRQLLVRKGIK